MYDAVALNGGPMGKATHRLLPSYDVMEAGRRVVKFQRRRCGCSAFVMYLTNSTGPHCNVLHMIPGSFQGRTHYNLASPPLSSAL